MDPRGPVHTNTHRHSLTATRACTSTHTRACGSDQQQGDFKDDSGGRLRTLEGGEGGDLRRATRAWLVCARGAVLAWVGWRRAMRTFRA